MTTALTEPRLIAIRHHDLSSLMAGKLNAVLSRPYFKGRDWYDLLWYLAERVDPNLELLGNGLVQNPSDFCADAREWRGGILKRMDSLDWARVVQDVRPFLEDRSELAAFTPDTLRALLTDSRTRTHMR